jgi:hypothetical protein
MVQRLDFQNFSASASMLVRDIDPIRFGHQYTMLLAFLDKPIFGNGLGSFYANYHRFFPKAQALGAGFYVDPPSSVFLMLAADLGIAGVILFVLLLGLVVRQILFVARTGRELNPLTAISLGIATNLVVCSLIGIHLIFTSVSALAGVALAILALDYERGGMALKVAPAIKWLKRSAFVFPVVSVAVLWMTAPRAPEFRWRESGHPQAPLGLIVPIAAPAGGTWTSAGVDRIYSGDSVRLFVEMPPEKYPLTAKVRFFDQRGLLLEEVDQVIREYVLPAPGRELEFNPSSAIAQNCAADISPTHYCSYTIEVSPHWNWQGQRVAAAVLPSAKG